MADNNDYIIVQTIKNFLGEPKIEVDPLTKQQWQFNCPTPTCRHDSNKFNLEYHSGKHVFKCWKCEYSGFVYKLFKDYGSKDDYNRLKTLLPPDRIRTLKNQSSSKPKVDHKLITCDLPKGYMPLGRNKNSNLYKLAWDYLVHERKVSPAIIDKYEIGYTENGPRKHRIIIPSKNALGRFNYYEARSYLKDPKIPYLKPKSDEVAKNDIIFNEYFINWDLPIFLVEGVFDMFRLPNAIPVLGKEVSELLTNILLKNNCTVILCFDPDAIQKTVETYKKLSSLGLDVFFVDLRSYKKDISKIYEDHGKQEVAKAVMNIKKPSLSMEIEKYLEENG